VHAVPFAGAGEAALDAAEAGERLADLFGREAELIGDRDGGGRVQRIVMARHRQHEIVEVGRLRRLAVAQQNVEPAHAALSD